MAAHLSTSMTVVLIRITVRLYKPTALKGGRFGVCFSARSIKAALLPDQDPALLLGPALWSGQDPVLWSDRDPVPL